jgi:nitrilase
MDRKDGLGHAEAMLRVAAAQDAPVFLDRAATTRRVLEWMEKAAAEGVRLLAFGETFLPGYPFWLSSTGGARFDDPAQKEAYAAYLNAAVRHDGPELAEIAALSKSLGLSVVLGIVERAPRGDSGSVYCSLVPVSPERGLLTPHRKLVPTHEERLAWAPGAGHGLRVHELAGTRVSALNCWENWMPLARQAVRAQGPSVHVALWPGAVRNTQDITRFAAFEGRQFVLSASAVLTRDDVPAGFPLRDELPDQDCFHDGGSAIAAPDGRWLVEPVARDRRLVIADLDLAEVARERQTLDVGGHYSRPDVLDLKVDRRRREAARFED